MLQAFLKEQNPGIVFVHSGWVAWRAGNHDELPWSALGGRSDSRRHRCQRGGCCRQSRAGLQKFASRGSHGKCLRGKEQGQSLRCLVIFGQLASGAQQLSRLDGEIAEDAVGPGPFEGEQAF
jgi:hypothetical protein